MSTFAPSPFAPSRPLQEPPPGEVADSPRGCIVSPGDPLLVLIAGGPARVAGDLERMLQTRIGMSVGVVRVAQARDALAKLRGGGFDAVLVFDDLVGRATLRELREQEIDVATVCVVERVEALQRAKLRAQLRYEGALACVFAEELSAPVIESAVLHAVEMQRVIQMFGSTLGVSARAGSPREEIAHQIAAAQARLGADPQYRYQVVHIDAVALRRERLAAEVADRIEKTMLDGLGAALGGRAAVHLQRGSYALLIEDAEAGGAGLEQLEAVRSVVQRQFSAGTRTLCLEAGIGVVRGNASVTAEDQLERAIEASRARAGTTTGTHELAWLSGAHERPGVLEVTKIEGLLRRALDKGAFSLWYQPIVDLERGRPLGFEALLRLSEAGGKDLVASDFISEAERSQLIVPMGYWALEAAIRQMTEWDRDFELAGKLGLSVNLSTCQCEDPTLLARIESLLMTTGLPAPALRVEIGAEALRDAPAATRALMHGLAKRHVRIWIEDFGSGVCSVDDLRGLPVAGLKIGRKLVHALDGTSTTTGRIKHIVDAARSLRAEAIAVGIENDMHANVLRWLGCRLGQGYLYARPMPVGDVFAYLAKM